MKQIIRTLLLFGLLLPLNLFAQQRTITGTVTSAEDGKPIPGVSVIVKGLGAGTSTKSDGTFKLSVRNARTLVFTFVSYESQEIEIGNQSELKISLRSQRSDLEQVNIVGSRSASRTKLNSPSPVDVIDIKAL